MAQDTFHNDSDPQSSNAGGSSLTLADYLAMIRERWFVALLVASLLAGYFAYSKLQEVPLFKAQSKISFNTDDERILQVEKVVENDISRGGDAKLREHFEHMRSIKFSNRLADSFSDEERELILRDYRDPETGNEPSLVGIVRNANQTFRQGGQVFVVEFHHRNPEACRLLTNRFVNEYIEMRGEQQRNANEVAIRFLRAQSEELKLKVERGKLALQQFRRDKNMVSLEESENIVTERMLNLSASLNETKVVLLELETQLNQVRSAQEKGVAVVDIPTISNFANIAAQKTQLSDLRSQREILSIKYLERHPQMVTNERAIEAVQGQLEESTKMAIFDLEQRLEDQRERVQSLTAALIDAKEENLELAQVRVEYNSLRDALAAEQNAFLKIRNRLEETIISSQLTESGITVIDEAFGGGAPFRPDRKGIITQAVGLFFVSFIAVPIGLAFLNQKVKTPFDVEHFIGKEFFGEIHKVRRKGKNISRVVLDGEFPHISELFRILYSHITLQTSNEMAQAQVFVITSMAPREGKSFTTANLAATFAKHDKKTLLIDCDLRRPSMHKAFGVSNKSGLLSWYNSKGKHDYSNTDGLTVYHIADGLDFIPAGGATQSATEVLASPAFKHLISRYRQQYDNIIIDTPPAAAFPDALTIGGVANHFIFVCKQNTHNKRKVRAVIRRLDQSQASVLGVVFNLSSKSKNKSYYGSSYYEYDYQNKYYTSYDAEAEEEELDTSESAPQVIPDHKSVNGDAALPGKGHDRDAVKGKSKGTKAII